jgi:hypothetical protein
MCSSHAFPVHADVRFHFTHGCPPGNPAQSGIVTLHHTDPAGHRQFTGRRRSRTSYGMLVPLTIVRAYQAGAFPCKLQFHRKLGFHQP